MRSGLVAIFSNSHIVFSGCGFTGRGFQVARWLRDDPPATFGLKALAICCAIALGASVAAAKTPPLPDASPKRVTPADEVTAKLLGQTEAAFRRDVAGLVAQFGSLSVSDDDLKQLAAAAKAVAQGNIRQIVLHRAAIENPTAIKIADWLKLRAGVGTLKGYRAFLDANPDWPSRALIRRRMETVAFLNGGALNDVAKALTVYPPSTCMGRAALASAKLFAGNTAGATKLAAEAWRQNEVKASAEAGFLKRFGALLTRDDHLARVKHLLAADISSRRTRNRRGRAVRRVRQLLGDADKAFVNAQLALYLGQAGADKRVAQLPEAQRNSAEVKRQLAQRLRRSRKHEAAAKLLAELPAGEESGAPDADWQMRSRLAREMLEAGNAKLAYRLVKDGNPTRAESSIEQAFLAGWIALRKLDRPRVALRHFKALEERANGPLSRSRAGYWLGRTHRRMGDTAAAVSAFDAAGKYLDTFHGALARVDRAEPVRSLTLPLPDMPDRQDLDAVGQDELFRAARIARAAGLSTRHVRALFEAFARKVDQAGQLVLAAAYADEAGDGQISLRVGKIGVARGFPLYSYSYPVHRFPKFEPLKSPPPKPEILLSIARQESEFNAAAISHAGARGLLQVMPGTARAVCRSYRIRCNVAGLRRSIAFNARIAAAYISDQMDAVEGHKVLMLTSYNAGPGRTRRWLKERGDPRTSKVDALDWVYEIPFEETRLYVQKVLSNVQVYRARLGDASNAVRIDQDLGLLAE